MFKDSGSNLRLEFYVAGFRIEGLGFRAFDFRLRVEVLGFRVDG